MKTEVVELLHFSASHLSQLPTAVSELALTCLSSRPSGLSASLHYPQLQADAAGIQVGPVRLPNLRLNHPPYPCLAGGLVIIFQGQVQSHFCLKPFPVSQANFLLCVSLALCMKLARQTELLN